MAVSSGFIGDTRLGKLGECLCIDSRGMVVVGLPKLVDQAPRHFLAVIAAGYLANCQVGLDHTVAVRL
jgi:hypothetical protein